MVGQKHSGSLITINSNSALFLPLYFQDHTTLKDTCFIQTCFRAKNFFSTMTAPIQAGTMTLEEWG